MNIKKTGKIGGITALVVLGLNAIYGLLNIKKAKTLDKDYDIAVTFGEKAIDMSKEAKEITCGAMFCGLTLDFRNCQEVSEPYEIDLFAKFAGVEIIVPENWFVQNKGKIAMAGVENYTVTYENAKPSLILHHHATFSGISIKNVRYS
jgi:hypothetical protein